MHPQIALLAQAQCQRLHVGLQTPARCLELPEEFCHVAHLMALDIHDRAGIGSGHAGAAMAKMTRHYLAGRHLDLPRRIAALVHGGRDTRDFCIDRISNGMKPSCVHVCPTGCMNYGTEEEMRALAKTRLEEVKKHNPQATLGNDDVRVMYLFAVDPKNYSYNAVAEAAPTGPMTRREVFASIAGKPKA